jgi:hypothetical protein
LADVVVPEARELPVGATVSGCPGAAVDEHPVSTAIDTATAPGTARNLMTPMLPCACRARHAGGA